MEITGDLTIMEVLEMDKYTIPIFMQHGLQCLGCNLASTETIEEACALHGIDLQSLLQSLNQHFFAE